MFTHEKLDTPFTELVPDSTNNETPREFVRASEEEFGLAPRDIDTLDEQQLNQYIDWLDELWSK